jgi:hypothetical protein
MEKGTLAGRKIHQNADSTHTCTKPCATEQNICYTKQSENMAGINSLFESGLD